MNTKSLKCVLSCDKELSRYIVGVFPANQLPSQPIAFPFGFIANTDTSEYPGEHWCAYYATSPKQCYFFDSFGHKPGFYNSYFKEYFESNEFKVQYNTKRLQSDRSKVCGQYCLLFLLSRTRNVSLHDFLKLFSSNSGENDTYVFEVIKKMFPFCL